MSGKTVKELREEKKNELEEIKKEIEQLEKEVDRANWNINNREMHIGKLRELDKLYLRRREVNDFLKEIDLNGRRLIRKGNHVMTFRGKDE